MNIIDDITIRHLRKNRGRTIITIIGICVSVAMVTAIFTGMHSYLDYKGQVAIYTNGDYHFSVTAEESKLNDILGKDERIASYGIEYTPTIDRKGYRIPGARYKHRSIGSWICGDTEYLSKMVTCAYDGTLPTNPKEIMIEQELITDNNLDWNIGDTVKIDSGGRYIGDDYIRFPKNGQYQLGEIFDYASTDSYKITGIMHGNFHTKSIGSMIVRGADADHMEKATAFVTLKHITPLSPAVIDSITDKFHFSEKDRLYNVSINHEYLYSRLALDKDATDILRLLPICGAVLLMIIIASVALIYNSFAISLSERVRYLGMLASVGATRRQKKKSVLHEALLLSAMGVPAGILTGLGIIGITFALIGDRIRASAQSGNLGSVAQVRLGVKVSVVSIAVIAAIGVATVLISALLPSRRAGSISAIAAIRSTGDIKIRRRIRTPLLIKTIFGCPGAIAFKNMRRNGAKSRIIAGSIALSLVLFLGCNYFCDMFVISRGMGDDPPHQVEVGMYMGPNDANLADFDKFVSTHPEIKKYYSIEYDFIETVADDIEIPLMDDFLTPANLNDGYKDLGDNCGRIIYRAIEDDVFNALCKSNGIDPKPYYDYEYGCRDYDDEEGYRIRNPIRVLLLNDYNHTDDRAGKPFNSNVIGTTQGRMSNPDNKENLETLFGEGVTITPDMRKQSHEYYYNTAWREQYIIHGLVDYDKDNYIFHLDGASSVVAFYPISVYKNIYPHSEWDDEGVGIDLGIVTDDHAGVAKLLSDYFEDKEMAAGVYDREEWSQRNKSVLLVLQVLIYGFILLISIITISNIINTLAGSIEQRKKEFAMLRSVGLDPAGFRRMLVLESLFYAIGGIVPGLPLSVIVCYIINRMMTALTIPFSMDIKLCVVGVCAIIAMIGLTMLYSTTKIRRSSIIDELRTDID